MKPRLVQTLELVRRHHPISRGAVAKALGVAPATASIYLQDLQDLQRQGLISSIGFGCKATWAMALPEELGPPPSSVWSLAKAKA